MALNINHTFKFLTDAGNGNFACWCTSEGLNTTLFRDFCQYILDNCNDPSAYTIYEVETGTAWKFEGIAVNWLKMRKRTFDERTKNTQTGIWAKC